MANTAAASPNPATPTTPAALQLERQYVTIEEAAAMLGVSHATIRRRVRDGSLVSWQPGGPRSRILIPHTALSCPPPPSPTPAGAVREPSKRNGPRPRWMKGPARRSA